MNRVITIRVETNTKNFYKAFPIVRVSVSDSDSDSDSDFYNFPGMFFRQELKQDI